VAPDGIAADLVERERRIAEQQVVEEGKPENIRAKIVEGKIKKFLSDRSLVEQKFVKDPEKTVGDLVKEASGKIGEAITVRRFARFQIGEA
jgi:elongation factor Ts